ncbi:MAG: LysR family transcriptional regulator, partial [Rhodoferax sp.]|nr:LysR family transcriptional regulator [Rhodoferax sp.]
MLKSLPHITARLKFRQLALLVALEEHGSLHRAAQALSITQSGLTKALREVEATFGMALFVRSSKGVAPNELGRCVLRYARLIDADLDHMREEIDGVLRGSGGRLAVGAITGALHSLLIGAMAALRTDQPALAAEVREGTSSELLGLVNAGRLDLAICRTTVAAQPEQFDYEPLLEEKVAFAVGPQHPLARARRVSLAQLARYRWICYPAGMPLRSLMEREFREAGLALPLYPTETSSSFATMLMLQQDPQMVAMVSSATMDFCETHHIAVRLPLAVRSRHEAYGIVTRRGATLSAAASLLVA